MSRLILASASPRRRELLARVGVPFTALAADVEERRIAGESPVEYAERLAAEKAAKLWQAGEYVLGADTIVVLDGDVLEKPAGEAEARAMVARLAERSHTVITACFLVGPDQRSKRITVSTEVRFRALSAGEIADYVASGEWRGKAGGYAAQGIAAAFIQEVHGSYTNVVGLPLVEVLALLAEMGAPGAQLARGTPA